MRAHFTFFVAIFLINCGQVFNYGTINAPALINPSQDAQNILIAPDRTVVLDQMFPHRIFYQRQLINNTYTGLNSGNPLVPGNYFPLTGSTFQDLLYATIAGPMNTFTGYMYSSLEIIQGPSYGPILIEILVVAGSDKQAVIDAYNKNPYYGGTLADAVSSRTQNDYRNFLQELIRRNREPDTQSVNTNDVNAAIFGLGIECTNWNNGRNLIDYILMEKSIQFAQQVINQFPAANKGKTLVQAVYDNISDPNLKYGYASLIYYILDPVDWVAARIHDSQNELDQHATKILFIVPYSECCLYEINLMFKKKYGMTIGQYLRSNNPQDPVDLMLAAIADDAIVGYI
ncbi:uncharacterized protein LOC135833786 [Planococcus citri]|uniref:uncharacterized protein LOC135833786 n=1 Tax=Planococcus citri TaxID=170843 RepID=UPI0031F9DF7C